MPASSFMPFLSSMRRTDPRGPDCASFPAEEHVGRDVQRRGDRQGLVDRLDAGTAGILRRLEVNLIAIQVDLSGVGDQGSGQGLDQRRLAGAVVADDREDLARKQVDVHTVETDDLAEGLDQPAARQHCFAGLGEHRGITEPDRALLFFRQVTGWRRRGHAFTFLIHWSMVTATMISTPIARIRSWSSTPARASPLLNA